MYISIRIAIVCFAYVNGLPPQILWDWIIIRSMCEDQAALKEVEALQQTFERGKLYDWYAWNMANCRYQ